MSFYINVRRKDADVMSTLTVQNKCTVHELPKFVVCEGKIHYYSRTSHKRTLSQKLK
jgi:hypothetical protein